MTNLQVIQEFLRGNDAQTPLRDIVYGYYMGKGRTLYTKNTEEGFSLINYDTRIAFIVDNILFVNKNKYSRTTSKIQGQLRTQTNIYGYTIKEYIEVV